MILEILLFALEVGCDVDLSGLAVLDDLGTLLEDFVDVCSCLLAPDEALTPNDDLLEELLELEGLLPEELFMLGDLVVFMLGDFPEPELVLGDLLM